MTSIHFAGAARTWLECLPLGDGRLGVMTDGGVQRTTLHLNDATAWSGSPRCESADGLPDAETCARLLAEARAAIAAGDPIGAEAPLKAMQTRYGQSFVPLGTVTVSGPAADDAGVRRTLDLRTGTHRASAGRRSTTTFIVAEHSVLVHVIDGHEEADETDVRISVSSPLRGIDGANPRTQRIGDDEVLLLRLPSDVAPGHEPDLPAARWEDDALRAAVVVRVSRRPGRTVVLVATATTFDGVGREPTGAAEDAAVDARRRLDHVASIDPDTLCGAAAAATAAALGDVSLEFDEPRVSALDTRLDDNDTRIRFAAARADPRGLLAADPALVALLFDYGRYLLVSSSRSGGLPANLQGIWNDELRPPWGSAYTLNINTQMNYWGAQVTDLSPRMAPLSDFTLALAGAAAPHTRRLYGAPGWTVHHNSDAWLYSTFPGRGAGDPRWAFWPLGGAWLATLLTASWEHGAADRAELERVWPALRGAAEFALAWSVDGNTAPATSPENAFLTEDGRTASLAETTTMDLALIRGLLSRTALVAAELGKSGDPVAQRAAARAAALPSQPPIAPDGTIVEWDVARPEEDPQHRHVSALFGLFPGDEPWDDEHCAAAARTLDRRGDDSSGWSLVWKLALWARLGRADKVADLLAIALRDATKTSGPWAGGLYPNLFAAHPPFQIDANLGFVGALSEALLQSHDGIRLLPAVPAALATGRVQGLVARPGVIVSLDWREGQLLNATLRARTERAAGSHRVHWGDRSVVVRVDIEHDTVLDTNSFFTEEVGP